MSFRLNPAPKLPRGGVYWVAYSGGVDSTVLLHRLRTAGLKPLRAIHVHHGLQAAADGWARHCRQQCRALKIPLSIEKVRVSQTSGEGPEAAARAARHAAFRKHLKKRDCLVTAHHADDQAETLLLRLLRGSGVRGLAAMRPLSDFASAKLWRPLLGVSRAEILAYAKTHQLKWIEDPHNRDPRYSRSWLRSELMPQLRARYPALIMVLTQTAELNADASDLLDEYGKADLEEIVRGTALHIPTLRALSSARRHHLLRLWLEQRAQQLPPAKTLTQIDEELLNARADATPVIGLGETELRRYRDHLYLLPRMPPVPVGIRIRWNGRGTLSLPEGCGSLRGRSPRAIQGLEVCFPSGGEKLKPLKDAHTRTLKNLCQQAGIPPWIRERLPLVYRDGELIAIADLWRSAAAAQLRLAWSHPLQGI